ncbi:MAG: phosphatase PAP2 family protein [Chitinophagaceae bacterium]|nr:phosphatase PAP2 family protein [Chitinophagaceae bacterium]
MMKRVKKINSFFGIFALCFSAGLYLFLLLGKELSFVTLNKVHNSFLDNFFSVITLLGDGVLSILVFILLLLIRQYKVAFQVITAFIFSGLAAQSLKSFVAAPRPATFFPKGSYHYFIDGVTHIGFSSFPSGHTASVFALLTVYALNDQNQYRRILYAAMAVLTGYSRMYLGQHFLGDVLGGAAVGVIFGVLSYYSINYLYSRRKKEQTFTGH